MVNSKSSLLQPIRCRWPGLAIAAGAVVLPACNGQGRADTDDSPGTVQQSIYYGNDVPQPVRYPGLVNVNWAANGHAASCGGTLISPTRVLTAGHCVHSTVTAPNGDTVVIAPVPANFQVYAGRYHRSSQSEGQVVGVSQIIERSDYVEPYANDVAILVLASAVSATPARITSPSRMAEIKRGDSVDLVGWGMTESGQASETPKYISVHYRCLGSACTHLPLAGGYYLISAGAHHVVLGLETQVGGIGEGDSGGPGYVFRDGEWFVFGVSSSASAYALYSDDTFVPDYFDWVNQNTPDGRPSFLPSAQIMAANAVL